MEQFRKGVSKVLIATDVLARGIDVPAVTLVVNYQIPTIFEQGKMPRDCAANGETYLHRVGRTGRFGMKGCAISLCDPEEQKKFFEIRDRYGITAHQIDEDYEILEETLKKLRQ
jgi:ATP-dependent RNA helicase DDX19/DBP5